MASDTRPDRRHGDGLFWCMTPAVKALAMGCRRTPPVSSASAFGLRRDLCEPRLPLGVRCRLSALKKTSTGISPTPSPAPGPMARWGSNSHRWSGWRSWPHGCHHPECTRCNRAAVGPPLASDAVRSPPPLVSRGSRRQPAQRPLALAGHGCSNGLLTSTWSAAPGVTREPCDSSPPSPSPPSSAAS